MTKIKYRAEIDKEFDAGSKINLIKLTKSKTNNLAILGKVWGFLKYYHPAIAKGNYNWDYELFRIIPKILEAKNQTNRNKIISFWIEGLGTFKTRENEKIESEKIKLYPNLSWINEEDLGNKLVQQLNNIKNAKRSDKSYYIGLFPDVGNPEFKNETAYSSMKYPDVGYRILSLFRYWNIIQYYFPYRHLIEENWADVLLEFIPKFINASDELEYKKAALMLIGRVHDTHANIWGQDEALKNYKGLNYAPVEIRFVEDQAVVTDYFDQILGVKSGLQIGDIIETVNNKKITEIIEERLSITPASNYSTKLRDIARNILRTNKESLKISYKRGKSIGKLKLKCYLSSNFETYFREEFQKPISPLKLITPEISYLYPGSLKEGDITKIIPEIAETKGLIVDLRCYPSDFIVFSLSEFLLPEETGFVKFSMGNITNPGLFTFMVELKVDENDKILELKIGKDNPDYYKGKVVILINEITQSNAEYTAMALRTAPQATVIGSTTSGADGNVSMFYLPGGIRTMISGIGVYYPDGRETQRIGIVPDIEVRPTIKGILEKRDELVEKAIEIINGK